MNRDSLTILSALMFWNTFVIPKTCSDPARAWDVIRYVFAGTIDEDGYFTGALPSLKSTFGEITEIMGRLVLVLDAQPTPEIEG